jgi:hypothetical protein
MAKRRGGRFKKMLGLGFISFEKAIRRGSKIYSPFKNGMSSIGGLVAF